MNGTPTHNGLERRAISLMFEFIFVLMVAGELRATEFFQTQESCQSRAESLKTISVDATCIPTTKEEVQIS
jgi:hypothetical protein